MIRQGVDRFLVGEHLSEFAESLCFATGILKEKLGLVVLNRPPALTGFICIEPVVPKLVVLHKMQEIFHNYSSTIIFALTISTLSQLEVVKYLSAYCLAFRSLPTP